MKIQNKEHGKAIFFAILLMGIFFAHIMPLKVQAATLEEQCIFSGGTFGSITNRCTNCGCGKVTGPGQGAVCVTKAEYDLAVSFANPADAPEIQVTECKPTVVETKPKHFDYQLLEMFPGFFAQDQVMTDFPGMVLAIYKFGIWTVGIAGLFMLVVGGFTYMTSAGNTSTAGSGKKIIWDALLGIVAALGAYLILYVINPDLTRITIGDSITSVDVTYVGPGPSTSGSGSCKPITDPNNACNVDRLKFFVVNKGYSDAQATDWATKASSICNAESGGKVAAESGGKCNGTPIAYGLFQINLNAWCNGAFTGKWNKSAGFTNGGCSIKDATIFNNCKKNAIDPTWNMEKMWELYQKSGWKPWEVTLNGMCPNW